MVANEKLMQCSRSSTSIVLTNRGQCLALTVKNMNCRCQNFAGARTIETNKSMSASTKKKKSNVAKPTNNKPIHNDDDSDDIDAIFASREKRKQSDRQQPQQTASNQRGKKVKQPLTSDSGSAAKKAKPVATSKRKSDDAADTSKVAAKKRRESEGVPYQDTAQAARKTAILDDDAFGNSRGSASRRKFTEEGFPIYTMEELNLDKNAYGGGTRLCPFDCNCCF
jgi:hypothetical protein